MDWFEGKSTGNHGFDHHGKGFSCNFPTFNSVMIITLMILTIIFSKHTATPKNIKLCFQDASSVMLPTYFSGSQLLHRFGCCYAIP